MRLAGQGSAKHTYRLKIAGNSSLDVREIEFEATGSEVALRMAHQLCGVRPLEMFEDGHKLADLQLSPASGFWFVS
jgi:hypothetical protein